MSNEKENTAFLEAPVIPKKTPGGNADAVLVAIHPPGPGLGRRFALNKDEHILGRLEELDIPLEGDGLSRRHARIYRDAFAWYVEDLESTNGTHVNDVRITKQQLFDGDLVRCGVAICKFLSGDNIEAAYHEEIYRTSIMDGLTGVHNKRFFLEFIEHELAGAVRHGAPLSLIMIDIDHFKKINDTHGHLTGDAALKELCRRLKPRVRASDLLARYGGEEFAVVMPGTPLEGGVQLAEVLRGLVAAEPFVFEEISIPCTISLGVAALDLAAPGTVDELIARADAKLYEAKHGGRNRVAS